MEFRDLGSITAQPMNSWWGRSISSSIPPPASLRERHFGPTLIHPDIYDDS